MFGQHCEMCMKPEAQSTRRVGLYFTPPNPGVSRPITPDHALITPFWGREHTKVAPISLLSNLCSTPSEWAAIVVTCYGAL